MKKSAIIFGAGSKARMVLPQILEKYNVIYAVDNDSSIHGKELSEGIKIMAPDVIKHDKSDVIVFCNTSASTTDAWIKQLNFLGVTDLSCVDFSFCVYGIDPRCTFLKQFAEMHASSLNVCVAEAGVYKGDFASLINKYFKNNKLYLFDTFNGFDLEDISIDEANTNQGRYADTSVELVMSKMQYPEKVEIRKGFFPETAKGIDDKFVFVNLDMDLEQPTFAGLQFFSDKLSSEGIILVHDYFNQIYPGARKAVDKFLASSKNFKGFPIGDDMSIMIVQVRDK